jgi:hypothetical protein
MHVRAFWSDADLVQTSQVGANSPPLQTYHAETEQPQTLQQ